MIDQPPLDARCEVDPPLEPPPYVESEIMWRMAVMLWREHQADTSQPTKTCASCDNPTPCKDHPLCIHCNLPWPCSRRRVALLGLNRASGYRIGSQRSI